MPLPLAIAAGAALLRGAVTAATLAPLVKPAVGIAKRFLKTTARPGIGSKVTKGPLMLGKTTVYGKARPGIGRVLTAAGAAAGGVGVVASHRSSSKPATQSRPQVSRPSSSKTETKKCCPIGTKRMVCFKRGRVKKRKVKARKGKKPRRLVARKRAKKSRRTRKG